MRKLGLILSFVFRLKLCRLKIFLMFVLLKFMILIVVFGFMCIRWCLRFVMVWLLMRFDFVMNRWLVKLIWCCIILCLLSCVFVCFVLISVMIVLSRKLLVILLLMKNVCVMGFGFVRLVVLIMMWLKLSLFLCFFVVRLLSVWVRLLWIV